MISKSKLLRQIEEKFKIKTKAEEILYYTGFEWRDDPALEKIEIYKGSRIQRLNNDMITEYEEYVLVYSYNEVYLLLKINERKIG